MSRRTRPRLFSFSREIELGHYDEVVRSPRARADLERVVDAFIAVCGDRRLSPDRLDPIVAAAASDDVHVRLVAMNRLAVLCHYFDDAIEQMRVIVDHPDPDVRLLACAALGNVPAQAATELLARTLADADWRVRKAAAQVAATVPLPGLVPVLSHHALTERDARVRVVLQLALDFQDRPVS